MNSLNIELEWNTITGILAREAEDGGVYEIVCEQAGLPMDIDIDMAEWIRICIVQNSPQYSAFWNEHYNSKIAHQVLHNYYQSFHQSKGYILDDIYLSTHNL